MDTLKDEIAAIETWLSSPRFKGITRLYSARQVAEQRGTIRSEHRVTREAAEAFYARLEELVRERKAITTFGPYTPGQAVVMKRVGIEAIYVGGWATSAKGSVTEDPGADLASYPLSQVPDEAAPIVRSLLAADKNQYFSRCRMTEEQRQATPEIDYRPFIIADADTGHGGEAHVRNLVRRFVEAGVPGYHIEDQKPGMKKCGHQGGKVLVPVHEQIQRLNAARFQLDIMGVPGIVVARTDAEAATLLDGKDDERDQPFLLGALNRNVPSCKVAALSVLRRFNKLGVKAVNGHLLHRVTEDAYISAYDWLARTGLMKVIDEGARALVADPSASIEAVLEPITSQLFDTWQTEAGLFTYSEAVARAMAFRKDEGATFDLSIEEWLDWSSAVSLAEATERAREMALNVAWDAELARTPEGYYPIRGGIEYATARSLAVAPFADILWMETKTADLADAKKFSDAILARYPEQMLAYNLSPSFNWDTTGMSDEEMSAFPAELGKLNFVFNFITYGGHQVDGLASDEFATALRQDGMLALARLQRKLRLIESPYRTPQTHVGGPRLDAALSASSGRTATTQAMGKGSTQVQHLIQTEVPTSLLAGWLNSWAEAREVHQKLSVELRPHTPGSDVLELSVLGEGGDKVAAVVFAQILDRRGRCILSVRDQNTYATELRRKRLMTLLHLFLIHRYDGVSVHYVSPTPDNEKQTQAMMAGGIFDAVKNEVGEMIVASVNSARVAELLSPDRDALKKLITGE